MKKIILIISIFFILTIASKGAKALYLEPASKSVTAGETLTIGIKASPSSPSQAIYLHLTVDNGEVLGYTDPTFTSTILGECPGNVKYNSSEVCVAITGNVGSIVNGTSLGSFQLKIGSTGTTTVTKASNNRYVITLTPLVEDYDTGTAGTYTIGALPNTSIFDSNEDRVLAFGAFLVSSGIGFYMWNRIRQKKYLQK